MKIALLGDIVPNGSFSETNKVVYKKGICKISNYLKRFDLVVANLEAPFSIKQKKYGAKSAFLFADPKSVDLLKDLNIKLVNLANNHMFDYGKEAYELTKKILKDNAIDWFGAEGKTVKYESSSNKLIFDGFCCYSTNPQKCVKAGNYGLNELDIRNIEERLHTYSGQSFLPIIAIHAGIEHVPTPDIDNIIASRRFTDICPYVYYGHHPHVVQGVELYRDSLIAHSLGNFIFDDNEHVILSEDNRNSVILEITIENNKIIDYKLTPIYIGKGEIKIFENETSGFQDRSEEFNKALENPKEYTNERMKIRNVWIANRKRKRNLKWYLKRLTPRYVHLFLSNRKNAKLYFKHVKFQL